MARAIEHEMYTYFMQLTDEQKKSVVKMIKSFIKGKDDENKCVTIEQYNRELEEAEKRIEAGNFITQEELEEEAKKLVILDFQGEKLVEIMKPDSN